MVNQVTGINLDYPQGKEKVDICKAIRDMCEESLEKGREEGKESATIQYIRTLIKP